MVILATAGQRHEALMLRKLMEAGAVKRTGRGRPRIRPAAVAGDKGYSHLSLRRYLRRRGIRSVIPPKSDQPRQPSLTKPPIGSAITWSVRSTGSRAGVGWRPGMRSAR